MPSTQKYGTAVGQLPDILKQYTKDCIRAQPSDIIQWSTDYFITMATGELRPGRSKDEKEKSLPPCKVTLTPGLLRALHSQVNGRLIVQSKEIEQKWNDLGLPHDILRRIMTVGGFGTEIEWMKFFALGCSTIDSNITNAMKYAFEILSSNEESGRIPYTTFRFLYSYLAMIDGEIHRSQIEKMLNNIERQVAESDGLVKVSDFTSNCR